MTTYTTLDIIPFVAKGRNIDITGKTFGLLTALGVVDDTLARGPLWLLRCQCGSMLARQYRDLMTPAYPNGIYSCGCVKKPRKPYKKRAKKPKPEVGSLEWKLRKLNHVLYMMVERCYNPKAVSWPNYGARGIRVCPQWLNDSTAFTDWALANGYAGGLHIDRIDNDGSYHPDNCRWVTPAENQRNRSTTKLTYEIAADIRARLARGDKPMVIANALGLRPHFVYNIKNNDAWGEKPRNYYRDLGVSSYNFGKKPRGDA